LKGLDAVFLTTDKGELVNKAWADVNLTKEQINVLIKNGISEFNNRLGVDLNKTISTIVEDKATTETRLAEIDTIDKQIKEIQQIDEDKSFFDKAKEVLTTNLTGEEFAKELLSFGGAKTALDEKEIQLSYLKERKQALEQGQDIALSESEYKNQIMKNEPALSELAMSFVPFEYAREGRWNTLQLWEKIVYPAVDVISLIPVAGLAGKGIASLIKAGSVGAKIAEQGGKQAVKFAATQALKNVEEATAKVAIREALVGTVANDLKTVANKSIVKGALESAVKDVKLAQKELAQITKESQYLQAVAKGADTVSDVGKGAKAYKATEEISRRTIGAAKVTEPLANIGAAGIISTSTVRNWDDLNTPQKVLGLGLASLTLGLPGKAFNAIETVVNPYKIPKAALGARAAMSKPIVGEIFKSGEGTVRLVVDKKLGSAEVARRTVADIQRQLQSGERVAKSMYGTKEVKVRGAGFQKVVGETAVTASPMGEFAKIGTGAAGLKTELEQYLEKIHNEGIKYDVKGTVSTPGLITAGKEGGSYTGASAYFQFSQKAAYGATGKIPSISLIGTSGISELPKNIARQDIKNMEKAAIKTFDGSKYIGQEVEGFKQYAKFMELENVITNGTQRLRVQNLRSKIADKLKLNQGEYFTRTKDGKVEIFQSYIEGGRTTPYTMKELYQLKGVGLQNALEDVFYGLGERIRQIGKSPVSDAVTKESQISRVFNRVDNELAVGKITRSQANELKKDILDKFRKDSNPRVSRIEIRNDIDRIASARAGVERAKPDTRIPTDKEVRQRLQDYQDKANRQTRIDEQRRIDNVRMVETRELPRSRSREDIRPVTREVPRGLTRAEARQVTRETPREVPRQGVRETPRQTPREQPRQTPRGIPREQPRQVPRETPRMTPRLTPREVPKVPPKTPPPKITFRQNGIKEYGLDRKKMESAIAWKQGFIYKLWYQPYGQNDVINTRKPIPGVIYYEGAGSAAKSLISKFGDIPPHIKRDMGVVDIDVFRTSNEHKPRIEFKPDRKQKTNFAGVARKPVKQKLDKHDTMTIRKVSDGMFL
jgi:hypothetical protein